MISLKKWLADLMNDWGEPDISYIEKKWHENQPHNFIKELNLNSKKPNWNEIWEKLKKFFYETKNNHYSLNPIGLKYIHQSEHKIAKNDGLKICEDLKKICVNWPEEIKLKPYKIYLFGSILNKNKNEIGDVDVIILFGGEDKKILTGKNLDLAWDLLDSISPYLSIKDRAELVGLEELEKHPIQLQEFWTNPEYLNWHENPLHSNFQQKLKKRHHQCPEDDFPAPLQVHSHKPSFQ
jgi:predicted nucleotidyltransferase